MAFRDRAADPELERADKAGVEFAGCAAVTAGRAGAETEAAGAERAPVCEIAAGALLRVFVPAPAANVAVISDRGRPEVTLLHEVQGGKLFELGVPPGATEIKVVDGARAGAFRLRVATAPTYPWAREVQELRDAGRLDDARTKVEALLPTTRGAERARATGILARVELARGELDAAVARLYEVIALDRAHGLRSAEADDSFALAFTLDQRLFRYTEARAVLARAAEGLADYPEGRARQPYYEGLVVADTNDVRGALLRFTDAEQRAERLGMTRLQRNARSSHAQQLAALGRRVDALAALRELVETRDEEQPCDRVDVLDAIGTWTLRALEVGASSGEPADGARAPGALSLARHARTDASADAASSPREARPPHAMDLREASLALEEAASLFPAGCADVNRHADVLIGLADVALRKGSLDVARVRLAEARRAMPNPRVAVALAAHALEASIALAEGRPESALAAYAALARMAGPAGLPEWEYTTALGRGEAYEAMGKLAEALAEYEHAEALVDNQSLWIPLEEGRSTFLADRERSARLHVDLLVRMGRREDAASSARASRIRVIAAFERTARVERLGPAQRAQWERSIEAYRRIRDALERDAAEAWKWSTERFAREKREFERKNAELRAALEAAFSVIAKESALGAGAPTRASAPLPGELVVVYHPVREGWIGFGLTSSGVETFRFEPPRPDTPPDEQAARLLGPLRATLAQSTRLRVLSYGPLRRIDFHALPWDDGVLLDRVPVVYGVDAPEGLRSHDERAAAGARRLALVVADPSSDLPGALLEARGVAVALRTAPSVRVESLVNDDAESVRVRELLPQAWLFHYAGHGRFAGRGGLESALALAADGTLTVGDILALPRSPVVVVLSGCETGRAAHDGAGEGLGLAHAFVLAGSRAVLAPVRPVEDSLAAQVSAAVYRAYAGGPIEAFDPASALRDALRSLRKTAPGTDWAAFRAVTP